MRNWISLIIVLMPALGCASFQDWHYMHTQKSRTNRAFDEFLARSGTESVIKDYATGWKAGYNDVLIGKSGQAPLVPPRKYWNPEKSGYSKDYGRNEWYKGYQDGATLASLEPDTHYIKLWNPEASHSNQVVELLDIEYDQNERQPTNSGIQYIPEIPSQSSNGWNSTGSSHDEYFVPPASNFETYETP